MNLDFLDQKLQARFRADAYRRLQLASGKVDFFSNDYLGMTKNGLLEAALADHAFPHGSTGSRLLAGNYPLMEETECLIAAFHQSPSALIFNSGYDANLGLLACVAERGDTILYDKLSHASIRDGIRLSPGRSFSFAHNDLEDLERKLQKETGRCFVVTESVFSMDGDQAPLTELVELCERFDAHLIVDEAHATGVIGEQGEGLMQSKGLHRRCFARVHTFGKALGCHGAVILGSEMLRNFLINFSRPFIYSTALPPAAVAAIKASYAIFPALQAERMQLRKLISFFPGNQTLPAVSGLSFSFRNSETPIQCLIVPGNEQVRALSGHLAGLNMDVRPILYPTVPEGAERLRIALHSYNTLEEVQQLMAGLSR
ncbi:MAG: 8-amino-7-oxononanoate synthase [Bacteroidota bacterium]|nr:8-amino-7-oxononanoate synthase [Bacteroidota bacterium]